MREHRRQKEKTTKIPRPWLALLIILWVTGGARLAHAASGTRGSAPAPASDTQTDCDDVGAVASLSGISERTQRLMRNMSDIVWSVDPERDTLEELLARMREFGAAVLEPKGIELRFETCGDLEGSLPPELKSNLYLIYKEAVNNVAKHAQATEVSVSFSHANNRLHMTITDNGKAMEADPGAGSAGGGNGLRNMRMRALEMKADLRIEGPSPQGTRIDLVLSL